MSAAINAIVSERDGITVCIQSRDGGGVHLYDVIVGGVSSSSLSQYPL